MPAHRSLLWHLRPACWQLLLGSLPPNCEHRCAGLPPRAGASQPDLAPAPGVLAAASRLPAAQVCAQGCPRVPVCHRKETPWQPPDTLPCAHLLNWSHTIAVAGRLSTALVLPPRRAAILERKRREYRDMVPDYYDIADRSADELGALRQVRRAGGFLGYLTEAEGFPLRRRAGRAAPGAARRRLSRV